MYYAGQIVFDLDAREPVQAGELFGQWGGHGGRRTTHFIRGTEGSGYEIALPGSVEDARELLAQGRIQPAPIGPTHCHKCMNWLTNHNPDGSCWTRTPGGASA